MVTALPLQQGMMDKTSGTFTDVTIVHCEQDGSIELEFNDGQKETYTMIEGYDAMPIRAKTVKIVSGQFTLATV